LDSNEENINKFINYFENKVKSIHELKFHSSNIEFPKILYLAIIDTLSRVTMLANQGNRERFAKFILDFSDWPHLDKISLPHLLRFLEKYQILEFKALHEFSLYEIKKWSIISQIPLSYDFDYKQISNFLPNSLPESFKKFSIEKFKHYNLFYNYRNFLFHEFREAGYGIEYPGDEESYYHFMEDQKNNEYSWELVYPLTFIKNICEKSIEHLRHYLILNDLNSYDQYNFGSNFITDLN